ncbi:tRNA (guanine-N(7)-)-methyltransferase [Winkia neuii]|uniref:tRNA (guanine-N(7)-)-methyltransferase n=2 Tax=Winkia neuii TaxID=33007 RepID=A0A2I1IPG1_9ACTO|nr:tRNA (guanine-N(7)-)-methyltransferase [Winkia neuii]PKY73008.1 tRNA (guanosine(46)-N7)-methyltransferase TrmB [Winkia neuii]
MEKNADFVVPIRRGEGYTTVAEDHEPLDFEQLFSRKSEVIVEIGSGTGDQILHAARQHPEKDFLAFEVWVPGIAKALNKLDGLTNVRFVEADVAQAGPKLLPEASVGEVWTFFPDPWRKARHHKRRLVQVPFAKQVVRWLRPGGRWRLATDWDDYAWGMRDTIESTPGLKNEFLAMNPDTADPAGARGGFAPRFAGRTLTTFEERGIQAGRSIHDLVAIRV